MMEVPCLLLYCVEVKDQDRWVPHLSRHGIENEDMDAAEVNGIGIDCGVGVAEAEVIWGLVVNVTEAGV